MLEPYLKLLDILKERKFSEKVREIRQTILNRLNSDQFSPHLHRYLRCNLLFIESLPSLEAIDNLPLQANEAYVRVWGIDDAPGQLIYVNKSTRVVCDLGLIQEKLDEFDGHFRVTAEEQTLSEAELKRVNELTGHRRLNEEAEPFSHFSHEPDQISQIKTILNVFHYAELALKDAEGVNLRGIQITKTFNKLYDLNTLYSKTIHYIYKAGYLATHLHVDFIKIFSQELTVLAPLIPLFETFVNDYGDSTNGLLTQMDSREVLHQLGLITGIVVDQMNPRGGEPDYEFLTRLGAAGAYYLEQLTLKIENFSSNVAEKEPQINKQKLDELQAHALQIINALEGRHSSALFLPLEALHYLHLLRHTLALSMSIFEQTGHLHKTTQDKVREKLSILKYEQLPQLFGLTDKIEELGLLAPGTLSRPLMVQMSRFYQVVIEYSQKFVDFSTVGQTLVVLECPLFQESRLQIAYARLADDKRALFKIEQAKLDADKFFKILSKPDYSQMRLLNLVPATKHRLAIYYQSLQPYVSTLDRALNTAIIEGLIGERGFLDRPYISPVRRLIQRHPDFDLVSIIIELQPALNQLILKASASHQLHERLNQDLIRSVSEQVEHLGLKPQEQRQDPFNIDEESVLNNTEIDRPPLIFEDIEGNNRLMTPGLLTPTQALTLYKFYQVEGFKLAGACQAFQAFCQRVSLHVNGEAEKKKLRNLYGVFQSYLIHVGTAEERVAFDKSMVAALTTDGLQAMPLMLGPLQAAIQAYFTERERELRERRKVFSGILKDFVSKEKSQGILVAEGPLVRNYHVIKHREFSKAVAALRASFSHLVLLFNDSVRAQLNGQEVGLPFPELDNVSLRLAQSSQALGLKRLFNGLYHLQMLIEQLENLQDNTTETAFVYTILQVADHLLKAYLLTEAIIHMPYFSLLSAALRHKLNQVIDLVQLLQGLFSPAPTAAPVNGVAAEHAPIFYGLNVMEILPPFILAQRANANLLPEDARRLHQSAEKKAADITRILGKSNSYFSLLFEIPTMYGLFRELKTKLLNMTTMTHEVVVNNLNLINDQLLTNTLLEMDEWEDNLGLKPGSLTTLLQQLFDAFYSGLLEPLGLNSHQHIGLLTSAVPLDERLAAALKRAERAEVELDNLQNKQTILGHFSNCLATYQEKPGEDPRFLQTKRAIVIKAFRDALSLLNEANAELSSDIPPPMALDQALDGWLNASNGPDNPLINIKALTGLCLSSYQGLHASHQQILDTAREKMAYLHTLIGAQPAVKVELNQRLTKFWFKNKLKVALEAQKVNLKHTELVSEYHDDLKHWLNSNEALLVEVAQNSDDISKRMTELLHEKIQEFNQAHYQNYDQFDRVIGVISRWQRYVSTDHPVFESGRTLGQKKELAKQLQALASRKEDLAPMEGVAVGRRLEEIQQYLTINEKMCEATMCNACYHPVFTWLWLEQTILSFLEWIRIYTPERKKCHDQLIQSMTPPTEPARGQWHVFFPTWPRRTYDLPIVAGGEQQPMEGEVAQPVLA